MREALINKGSIPARLRFAGRGIRRNFGDCSCVVARILGSILGLKLRLLRCKAYDICVGSGVEAGTDIAAAIEVKVCGCRKSLITNQPPRQHQLHISRQNKLLSR